VKPVTSTEWPACIFVLGKACNVEAKLRSLAGPSVKSAVALQNPDFFMPGQRTREFAVS
jgi:hypothetical protein